MPIKRITSLFRGDGLKKRTARGTSLTLINFAGANGFRLVSNLILTRLLFPEAFGLMAVVQIFTSALAMFSDIGIKDSVIRSDRADDPNFLNTAWTAQIIRGVLLWLAACALALPVAALYSEPLLGQILPVTGLNAIIAGFMTTNFLLENRRLRLGRIVTIDLVAQLVGLCMMVFLAWWWESVWALVFGALFGSVFRVIFADWYLPGQRNRFCLERESVHEIVSFGKFIFFSTITTFAINQSDKAILSGFITFAALGIYNIGFFLGSAPYILSRMIANSVVFPLYRMSHPMDSEHNRKNVFRMRRITILGALLMAALLGFSGPALVNFLYDPRYEQAGAIVTLIAFAIVPMVVLEGNMRSAMAKGDSRAFFFINFCTAMTQVVVMYFATQRFGLIGAILTLGLAPLLTYPIRIRVLIKYRSWDAIGEIGLMLFGFALCGWACWIHMDLIRTLAL